jgi:hypothetical protein
MKGGSYYVNAALQMMFDPLNGITLGGVELDNATATVVGGISDTVARLALTLQWTVQIFFCRIRFDLTCHITVLGI